MKVFLRRSRDNDCYENDLELESAIDSSMANHWERALLIWLSKFLHVLKYCTLNLGVYEYLFSTQRMITKINVNTMLLK